MQKNALLLGLLTINFAHLNFAMDQNQKTKAEPKAAPSLPTASIGAAAAVITNIGTSAENAQQSKNPTRQFVEHWASQPISNDFIEELLKKNKGILAADAYEKRKKLLESNLVQPATAITPEIATALTPTQPAESTSTGAATSATVQSASASVPCAKGEGSVTRVVVKDLNEFLAIIAAYNNDEPEEIDFSKVPMVLPMAESEGTSK